MINARLHFAFRVSARSREARSCLLGKTITSSLWAGAGVHCKYVGQRKESKEAGKVAHYLFHLWQHNNSYVCSIYSLTFIHRQFLITYQSLLISYLSVLNYCFALLQFIVGDFVANKKPSKNLFICLFFALFHFCRFLFKSSERGNFCSICRGFNVYQSVQGLWGLIFNEA